MNAVSTFTSPRWLGYFVSAIALVALLAAAGHTPLIEWGSGEFLLGGLLAIIVVWFFVAAYRGRINIIGNMSGKTAQTISVIGLFIAGLLIGSNQGWGDGWTVINIQVIGVFIVLAVLFFAAYVISAKKIRVGK